MRDREVSEKKVQIGKMNHVLCTLSWQLLDHPTYHGYHGEFQKLSARPELPQMLYNMQTRGLRAESYHPHWVPASRCNNNLPVSTSSKRLLAGVQLQSCKSSRATATYACRIIQIAKHLNTLPDNPSDNCNLNADCSATLTAYRNTTKQHEIHRKY